MKLDIALSKELLEVANTVLNDSGFRKEVNQIIAEKSDPYVPYITGALSKNITVTATGIIYNQPYAEEVYNSNQMHNLEQHPLASSRWDEVMYANHQDEIDTKIKELFNKWTKTKQ